MSDTGIVHGNTYIASVPAFESLINRILTSAGEIHQDESGAKDVKETSGACCGGGCHSDEVKKVEPKIESKTNTNCGDQTQPAPGSNSSKGFLDKIISAVKSKISSSTSTLDKKKKDDTAVNNAGY